MANIQSPVLFFVTSPRTPFKMRPEIDLLVREFDGQRWKGNTALQAQFMRKLAQLPEFEGKFNQNDPALSARDRITRGPKSLGFVDLNKIGLTPAGHQFLDEELADESLLRQLLKFQLPSPFHKANPKIGSSYKSVGSTDLMARQILQFGGCGPTARPIRRSGSRNHRHASVYMT